ncbi:LysE family translocator [Aquamicrobium zhengzhouense]|uniref:LysE family translocator n=1 Tax=Aquamicrobium zhengzhouense TaxID=2781738 RepID=A0ABS0SDY6_9HYPH|nr:LysE family translocator [Aquamicrobium zhengzhouense]MBI1620860.1 LysE family translocator [Aquamicrobium zhengzhouense]
MTFSNFIPDLSVIAPFTMAVLIITITPGPDMTLFVGRALSHGRTAGLACMAGAMTGIVFHTALVALGLSALIVASPEAFLGLKIFGAVYLVWLAWQAIRHGSAFSPQAANDTAQHSFFRNWATGLLINLMNPKILLFFMTFLPQFVSATDPHAPGKLFFLGLMFIVLALPLTVPMVLAADGFSKFLRRSPRVMRVIDYLFAGVFSAFAIKILTAQAR